MTTDPTTPRTRTTVSGAVLAGGRSRRMGRDKREVDVGGTPLLARAVAALHEVTRDVVVVVGEGDEPVATRLAPGVRAVTDLARGQGPLCGLATALATAATEVVLVVPGDHPALAPDVLVALLDTLAEHPAVDAALLGTDARGPQPLLGAYRRRAAATVQALLDGGERRAQAVVDRVPHVVLEEPTWRRSDPGGASVIDLDTPEDVVSFTGTPPPSPEHARHVPTTTLRVRAGEVDRVHDRLVGEAPLEVRVAGPGEEAVPLLTTLRTPGHEVDLALGWLATEGLLDPAAGPRVTATYADPHEVAHPEHVITLHLPHLLDLRAAAERRTAATASCGVCGRASIEELAARCAPVPREALASPPVPWSVLATLPGRLRADQPLFETTGGLHATGLFRPDGRPVTVREDVGRHNALDAAIGAHVRRGALPLHDLVAVLSGRVGFELVAKVAVAGIPVLAAVGAPTDLAVRTAATLGVTLVGFLRDGDGNVYTHAHRLDLGA